MPEQSRLLGNRWKGAARSRNSNKEFSAEGVMLHTNCLGSYLCWEGTGKGLLFVFMSLYASKSRTRLGN